MLAYGAFVVVAWITFHTRPIMVSFMVAALMVMTALYMRWQTPLLNRMLIALPIFFETICIWSTYGSSVHWK